MAYADDNSSPSSYVAGGRAEDYLALLKPQPPLTYLFSRNGYLFPRADAVVIGGTYRFGDATTNAEPDVIQQLVDHMRGVFGVGPDVPLPTRAPTVGQHTDEVLHEVLGYDDAKVAELRASGALG